MAESTSARSRPNDRGVTLGAKDWTLLRQFEHVVDGLALVLGSGCEVVLHALADPSTSVIKIANGHVTGRTVGSPMTDFGLEIMQNPGDFPADVAGVYRTRSSRGTPIKSTTILIRNQSGKLIGLLCINIDLAMPLLDFARELLEPLEPMTEAPVEHFSLNTTDLVTSALDEAIDDANRRTNLSAREKNRLVVARLHERGLFGVRGAVDVVARRMGVSRYTVYNYVREARADSALRA